MLRKILFPFAAIYYVVTYLRNVLFDKNILKSKAYQIPIVAVGNLNVGGTGKTPMVEYLIRLFKNQYNLAVLSRGYGRKTKGFLLASEATEAIDIGDEPKQFHTKFDTIHVAVDEDRQEGIKFLKNLVAPELIILDDAFQHRKVNAGFYVLLSTYHDLFYNDFILPAGNLREPRKGAARADVVIITKCPRELTGLDKEKIRTSIAHYTQAPVFFSSISYSNVFMDDVKEIPTSEIKEKFTLVTGIANPKPMVDYLHSLGLDFNHKVFKDHHNFSAEELKELKTKKLIITTEKDYVRLKKDLNNCLYLPIEVSFLEEQQKFDSLIQDFVVNKMS